MFSSVYNVRCRSDRLSECQQIVSTRILINLLNNNTVLLHCLRSNRRVNVVLYVVSKFITIIHDVHYCQFP